MRERFSHPAWALLLAPAIWLCLWHDLGWTSIETSDEAAHTDVARNIVKSGQWTRLWYFEDYYYGKPPLKIWLTSLLMELLGPDEWVVRLPDAAMATLTTLLVWWLARRYVTGPATLAAPSIFVLAPYPILEHGWREGVQESALVLLMTLAAAIFLRLLEDAGPRTDLWLAIGACLGAASLVKSVVPFILFGPILGMLLVQGRLVELRRGGIYLAGALAAMLWLSWHHAFLESEIRVNVIPRIAGAEQPVVIDGIPRAVHRGANHDAKEYWVWLEEGFTPWGRLLPLAALVALLAALRRAEPGQPAFDRWLVLWAAGLIVPWLVSKTKHPWYVYPAYPALSLMLARLVLPPEAWRPDIRGRLVLAVKGAGAILFVAATAFSVRQIRAAIADMPRVPLDVAAEWLQECGRSDPGEAPPLLAFLTAPRQTCPDERYYLDLAPDAAYIHTLAEVASLAVSREHWVLVAPEEIADAAIRTVLPLRPDVDISYDLYPPRCRRAYGVALPFRVILSFGNPPRPPFAELPLVLYHTGFGRPEPSTGGTLAWTEQRGEIKLVAGCGALRFRLLSHRTPRDVVIGLPGGPLHVTATPEGVPVDVVVDVPDDGLVVPVESALPCSIREGKVQRCLGIAVAELTFDVEPHTFRMPRP